MGKRKSDKREEEEDRSGRCVARKLQREQHNDDDDSKVTHDHIRGAVYLNLGRGKGRAKLLYEKVDGDDDKLELFHTEVPPKQRGRGHGIRLAEMAVRLLLRENKERELVLTCSFLKKFEERLTEVGRQMGGSVLVGQDQEEEEKDGKT